MNQPPGVGCRREERAFQLSAEGFGYRTIAEMLAMEGYGVVTFQGVQKMVKRVAKRFRERMDAEIDEEKGRQLAYLWHIYNEAMQAWNRSKTGERQVTGKKFRLPQGAEPGDGGPYDYTLSVVKEQAGAAEYLRQAREALADIRKLMGLNAPVPIRATVVPEIAPSGGGPGAVMFFLPHNGRDPVPEGAMLEGPPPDLERDWTRPESPN